MIEIDYIYQDFKNKNLTDKYITNNNIELVTTHFQNKIFKKGISVKHNPIYALKFGTGKIKILIWSQMHGNEPTTTKGLIDFMSFINSNHEIALQTLQKFTFVIIPILNPDGTALYTRENANSVDINRDFINQSQPETLFLLDIYKQFNPNFCFNLHDQRSIFAAGDTNNPATLSFLAPSYNSERNYNEIRLKAVNLIVFLNQNLQNYIPNSIGRFDDSFNINCAGDYFTAQNTPTVLIEAGHFPNDYNRENTRKYIFYSLFYAIQYHYENDVVINNLPKYLSIPQNSISFYDIIIKNVNFFKDNSFFISNFALQYKEVLINHKIHFIAHVSEIGTLLDKNAHLELNANYQILEKKLNIGDIANFKLENITFENGKLI